MVRQDVIPWSGIEAPRTIWLVLRALMEHGFPWWACVAELPRTNLQPSTRFGQATGSTFALRILGPMRPPMCPPGWPTWGPWGFLGLSWGPSRGYLGPPRASLGPREGFKKILRGPEEGPSGCHFQRP